MSDIFTSAGTTLGVVAGAPASYDSTGFSALVFEIVGEITNMGEFGREYTLVEHISLGSRRTVKRKGAYNDGALNLQLAKVSSDAGQTVLETAVDSDASVSCEVVLQDGTTLYFTAQVMRYTTNVGDPNQITGVSCDLEIDNDIVVVAAP